MLIERGWPFSLDPWLLIWNLSGADFQKGFKWRHWADDSRRSLSVEVGLAKVLAEPEGHFYSVHFDQTRKAFSTQRELLKIIRDIDMSCVSRGDYSQDRLSVRDL